MSDRTNVRGRAEGDERCRRRTLGVLTLAAALAFAAAPARAQVNFVVDTFTGANGSLSGHSPDTGNALSWVKLTGSGAEDLVLSGNQLAANATGVGLVYLNTTPPLTADYAVAVDVFFTGTDARTTLRLFGRFSGTGAADLNGYVLEFNPSGTNNLMVKTVSNGALSAAQCAVTQAIQAGANRVELLVAGNSITAKGPTQSCNWIDAGNLFTSAGAAGIGMTGVAANDVLADNLNAFSAKFGYRRSITVQSSQIPGSCSANLTNFPILVSVTDATLATTANGGHVQSANGYDIIFRDTDSVTQLDHELEQYDPVAGTVIAWVRVPTLAYNANTVIYMYYGNGAIIAPTANKAGVWDTNYLAVYHLAESPTGAVNDSTSNANNLSSQLTLLATDRVAAKIANGTRFDASSKTEHLVTTSTVTIQSFTLEAWVNTTFAPGTGTLHLIADVSSDKNTHRGLNIGATDALSVDLNTTTSYPVSPTGQSFQNAWHHVAGRFDSVANLLSGFIDGTLQAQTQAPGFPSITGRVSVGNWLISTNNWGSGNILLGVVDEVRLSNIPRSDCWIQTGQASMNAPGTFSTLGPETAAPTAIKLVSFSATDRLAKGVQVQWRTGYEVDNLGFHVYREQGGARVRITPSLVAGSALFAGRKPLTAGRSYSWTDRTPVAGAAYWLEEWDLKGARRWYGPVSVQRSRSLGATPMQATSALLSGLGARPAPTHLAARELDAGGVPGSSALGVQWDLAAGPAVKIQVREEGWYRVARDELVAAGLDPGADPRALRLYADGREVAIVVNGEKDGRLDAGDSIEFYGLGQDTPSTDARVYWLTAGHGRGDRVPGTDFHGKWAPAPASFATTVELKDRTTYLPTVLGGGDDFFGAVVTTDPVSQTVAVPHPDPAGPFALTVRLQGATDTDHQADVELNGVRVATVAWSGMAEGEATVGVQGLVREGDNVVTLTSEAGEADISLVDVIRMKYPHTWLADADSLRFAIGGYQGVTVGGFDSAAVRAFDVTDPWNVEDVTGNPQGGAGHAVNVAIRESGTRTVLAVGSGAVKHPAGLSANVPSSWHDLKQGADLVIIAHASLLPAVEPLRALRDRQGMKVAVVDAEDVYDEFSFGAKSPQAIRDFLAWGVRQWKRPPRYLLLVGNASYDPRNHLGLGYGDFDLVPTKLVDTAVLQTASDDWFADLNGDGIANLGVGRLPVQTADEAAAVVSKIVAYDNGTASHRLVLVADAGDLENDFEGLSRQAGSGLPASVPVVGVFRGQLGTPVARSALASQLGLGVTVVNYLGHGSVDVWHDDLLTSDLARALDNPRLAFWASMTCLNGFFQDPDGDNLAQALLGAPGGAVAVWASSGLTEANDQVGMDGALLQALFPATGQAPVLGDAVRAAKSRTTNRDVRRTWNLFGDPTTRLK